MADARPTFAKLDEWIAHEAISFSVDSPARFAPAADRMVTSLGDSVELLGLGEPMHGAGEFLMLRNALFRRLVEAHGFTAIAIESSFPRARVVKEYVAGCGAGSYDEVQEAGFSHGFGRAQENRELVEWMRQYNADPSRRAKLQFYGFDSPTEMMGTDSPRRLLEFALDFLESIDRADGRQQRERIEELLGEDADWENPAAMMDPSKSVGLSPMASALRIETEELISQLRLLRPDPAASGDRARYLEVMRYACLARELLTYHAALARPSDRRLIEGLSLRDAMMADNLVYAMEHERVRAGGGGKVFAFAHNSHLQRGQARWQLGPHALVWWTAGAHLDQMLGPRYAVIGTGIGMSDAYGIGEAEAGTLESLLAAISGPWRFVPTHRGRGIPPSELAALPTRSPAAQNPGYFPLTPQSLYEFDALAVTG